MINEYVTRKIKGLLCSKLVIDKCSQSHKRIVETSFLINYVRNVMMIILPCKPCKRETSACRVYDDTIYKGFQEIIYSKVM